MIISPEDYTRWLSSLDPDPRDLLVPYPAELMRWRGELPAFGRAAGIIINYSPDHAIRFDLEGNAVEHFDRAYRIGVAQFAIGGRVVSPGELFTVTETTR